MSQWIRLKSIQHIGGASRKPGEWVRVGAQLAERLIADGLADAGPEVARDLPASAGVVYVAYGAPALKEARASIDSVRGVHPDLPLAVVSDEDPRLPGVAFIPFPDTHPGAREAKLNVARLTPFARTLYLDADTVLVSSLAPGFHLLDRFDLALAVDIRGVASESVLLSPIDSYCDAERAYTRAALPTPHVTQYACGMVFFRRDNAVVAFFDLWRAEWGRWRGRDQAAFLRALHATPLRHVALPVEWNVDGRRREAMVVHHRWTTADRERTKKQR